MSGNDMLERIEALERLTRLKDQGALNEEEFARQKALLLDDAPETPATRPRVRVVALGVSGAVIIAASGAMAWWLFGRPTIDEQKVGSVTNIAAALPPIAMPAAPRTPDIRTLPADEQLARAFEAAFGRRGRATKTVDGSRLIYSPGRLIWVSDRAVLISPGRNEQDCHACAGTLAIHYLTPIADRFAVAGEWLTGGGFDDWGAPPEWRISTELTSQPALRTEGGGGNQGIFCNGVEFYQFGPNGPVQIAEVPMGHSSTGFYGDTGGAEISGQIRNVRRNVSFEVHYSGTSSFVEQWRWRGGVFQLQNGPTRVPEC
jgi:hypothetical protein